MIRDSGFASISPNLAKSIFGHGKTSTPPIAPVAGDGDAARHHLRREPEVRRLPERVDRHHEHRALVADAADRGRFSANRKTDAVVRLLRGEDLDTLSRELGVTAATVSSGRDSFLDGGRAALKSRPADDRDELIARLRAKVGQLAMDDELLDQRRQHLESGRPFAPRRRSG